MHYPIINRLYALPKYINIISLSNELHVTRITNTNLRFILLYRSLSLSLSLTFSSVWRQRRSPRILRGFRSLRRREMPEIRSSRGINTHKRIWAKPFISLECVVAADEPRLVRLRSGCRPPLCHNS